MMQRSGTECDGLCKVDGVLIPFKLVGNADDHLAVSNAARVKKLRVQGTPMEYSVTLSEGGEYIILEVVGEFTAKSFMKCIIEAHTLGMAKNIHAYLVDATRARNIDSAFATQQFAYQDMKSTEGVDPSARVAGLISPDDHSHDFVETVSYNAGMFFKLFTDIDEAKAYLLKRHIHDKPHK